MIEKSSAIDEVRNNQKSNGNIDDDGVEDYGFFHCHRGARQPIRMRIKYGVKSKFIRWPLTGDIDFDGSETIVIDSVNTIVTIKGKGLDRPPSDRNLDNKYLLEELGREKVVWLTESRETGDHIPSYVEKITVTPRE